MRSWRSARTDRTFWRTRPDTMSPSSPRQLARRAGGKAAGEPAPDQDHGRADKKAGGLLVHYPLRPGDRNRLLRRQRSRKLWWERQAQEEGMSADGTWKLSM